MRGRRRYGRLRLRIQAKVITVLGTFSGLVVDLSLTGARVRLTNGAPRSGDALLQWDSHEAFGRIVWTEGADCGIRFDEPLAENVLLDMREATPTPDEMAQVRDAAARFVNGRQGFASEPRPRVPFGRR